MKDMLDREFATYERSLALKELGFDEPCLKFYANKKLILGLDSDNGDTNSKLNQYNSLFVSAPLKQQVFRWFRDKYNLESFISNTSYMIEGDLNGEFVRVTNFGLEKFEEAESACIDKLIEIVKNK